MLHGSLLPGLAVLSFLLGQAQPALAAAGDLDPTFGGDGIVVSTGVLHVAVGMVIQADDRIVAAGMSLPRGVGGGLEPGIARYLPDGHLDPGFGQRGVVVTDFDPLSAYFRAVALQPDGKIVAAGTVLAPSFFDGQFLLMRYNPDGTLDPTFGQGGIAVTSFPRSQAGAWALALDPDGSIVAVGWRLSGPYGSVNDVALARYTPQGVLDRGFGKDGLVVTVFAESESLATGVAIQPDGRIVVGGSLAIGRFAALRYLPSGRLDSSFGSGGRATVDFPGAYDGANALVLEPGGAILLAGQATKDPDVNALVGFALVRLTPSGVPDTSFGSGGRVNTPFPNGLNAGANAVVLEADGKIVAAGVADVVSFHHKFDFGVVRYLPNGHLDPTFSGDGIATTRVVPIEDGAYGVALQKDGNIVAAGFAAIRNSGADDFALIRYLAS